MESSRERNYLDRESGGVAEMTPPVEVSRSDAQTLDRRPKNISAETIIADPGRREQEVNARQAKIEELRQQLRPRYVISYNEEDLNKGMERPAVEVSNPVVPIPKITPFDSFKYKAGRFFRKLNPWK